VNCLIEYAAWRNQEITYTIMTFEKADSLLFLSGMLGHVRLIEAKISASQQ